MSTILNKWMEDKEFAKGLFEEEFILDVTENILEQMEKKDLTRLDLANRLGKTKGFISQLLNGTRNMTLRTLADIAYALNLPISVRFETPITNFEANISSAFVDPNNLRFDNNCFAPSLKNAASDQECTQERDENEDLAPAA